MLQLKEIIATNGYGDAVVTLTDGRCALVNYDIRGCFVDVFIDSFLNWEAFNKEPTDEDVRKIKDILRNPRGYKESSAAKAYISDPAAKSEYDRIKKECGYDY